MIGPGFLRKSARTKLDSRVIPILTHSSTTTFSHLSCTYAHDAHRHHLLPAAARHYRHLPAATPTHRLPTLREIAHAHDRPRYQVKSISNCVSCLLVCLSFVCPVVRYKKPTHIYIYTAPARKGAASFLFTYIGLRHAGTLATLAQDKHTQTHTPYSGSPPGIGTPSLPKRTVRHYLPHVQQRQKTSSTYPRHGPVILAVQVIAATYPVQIIAAIPAILLPATSAITATGYSCYSC